MEELLCQRPIRRYGFEEMDEDRIRIVIPRFPDNWLGRFLAWCAIQSEDRLNLDEIGSFVYPLCDGGHTVTQIAGALKEKFGERAEPLEGRLTLFIREMFKRNLVTFARHE